ncbi:unnamed protein product [Schistosoma haematobium]|nr:unnamed protein product [Schistosoma haematobium]
MITGLHRTNSFQFFYKFRRSVSSQTHYDTLGIKKSASYSEIRSDFIELSKKYHPDKNDGDIKTFKRINEAYSVLSQENSRRIYDSSLVSRAKPLFTNSPNEYDVSDWERNYNYHFKQCTSFYTRAYQERIIQYNQRRNDGLTSSKENPYEDLED